MGKKYSSSHLGLLIYREIAGVRGQGWGICCPDVSWRWPESVGPQAIRLLGRISNELCGLGYDRGGMRSKNSRFDGLELMCDSNGRLKPNRNLAISRPAQGAIEYPPADCISSVPHAGLRAEALLPHDH